MVHGKLIEAALDKYGDKILPPPSIDLKDFSVTVQTSAKVVEIMRQIDAF